MRRSPRYDSIALLYNLLYWMSLMDFAFQGRKFWVKCVIEQDGVTCIDAECLYLKINVDNSKL